MSTLARPSKLRSPTARGRRVDWVSPGLLSLLAGIVAWEAIGQAADFAFFPPFSAVMARLAELIASGDILGPLVGSLVNLAIGFTISLIGGVAIGLAMGAYHKVDVALGYWVYVFLTAPSLVFAPVLFTVFGLGRESIIFIIVLYAMFIIIVNTSAAVKTVPIPLVEMGRSFGAGDRELFRRIVIPAALPLMMAGIRLGSGRAVKGMINGEMFIAAVGLGAVVIRAGSRFDSETVLAILVLITAVAFALVYAVQVIDRRLTAWLPESYQGGS